MNITELTEKLRSQSTIRWSTKVSLYPGVETDDDGVTEVNGYATVSADGDPICTQEFSATYPDSLEGDHIGLAYGDHVDRDPERCSFVMLIDGTRDEIADLDAAGFDPIDAGDCNAAIVAAVQKVLPVSG